VEGSLNQGRYSQQEIQAAAIIYVQNSDIWLILGFEDAFVNVQAMIIYPLALSVDRNVKEFRGFRLLERIRRPSLMLAMSNAYELRFHLRALSMAVVHQIPAIPAN
jgi:hypothetical protein